MSQVTLQAFMVINDQKVDIDDFDPLPAIEHWLSSAKTKRHLPYQKREHEVVHVGAGAAAQVQPEMPLLPAIPDVESESDSDSEPPVLQPF